MKRRKVSLGPVRPDGYGCAACLLECLVPWRSALAFLHNVAGACRLGAAAAVLPAACLGLSAMGILPPLEAVSSVCARSRVCACVCMCVRMLAGRERRTCTSHHLPGGTTCPPPRPRPTPPRPQVHSQQHRQQLHGGEPTLVCEVCALHRLLRSQQPAYRPPQPPPPLPGPPRTAQHPGRGTLTAPAAAAANPPPPFPALARTPPQCALCCVCAARGVMCHALTTAVAHRLQCQLHCRRRLPSADAGGVGGVRHHVHRAVRVGLLLPAEQVRARMSPSLHAFCRKHARTSARAAAWARGQARPRGW